MDMPTEGGRYARDPVTGALTPIVDDAAAPIETPAALIEVPGDAGDTTETADTAKRKG